MYRTITSLVISFVVGCAVGLGRIPKAAVCLTLSPAQMGGLGMGSEGR